MMDVRVRCRRLFYLGTVLMLTFLLALALALPASAAKKKSKKVALSEKKLVLVQYSKQKLTLKNAKGKVQWKAGNTKIATVSSKGLIRTLEPGSTRIIAKNKKKKYICTLVVQPLALSSSSLTIKKGSSAALTLNNTTVQAAWTSSNTGIATVDASGNVTAKGVGTCTITAVYKQSTLSCSVTVPAEPKVVVKPDPKKEVTVVLAGSSSLDMWRNQVYAGENTDEKSFSPCKITNTAISGTYVTQWIGWVPDRIAKYNPSAVVVYVGSNDLGNGSSNNVTAEQNIANTKTLLQKIRNSLPQAVIFYIGVNPCHSRKGAWTAIAASNSSMLQYCNSQANMYYIDIASACKGSNGEPNPAYFRTDDQLHPSAAGYAKWKDVVAGTVKRVMGVS